MQNTQNYQIGQEIALFLEHFKCNFKFLLL